MIGSISSNSMMPPPMSQSSNSELTSSQLDTISSVLGNYDAENLTQSDAQSIVEAFNEAGIQPSSELEEAMESAGFDAREVGNLAGLGGKGNMPPPPPSDEEITTISSLLDTLLSSEDDESVIETEDIMDYTSRILGLNDESKDEVMNLLDKYSSDDIEYSQEEINDLLKTSLSQILSDSNNYKSVSFYG